MAEQTIVGESRVYGFDFSALLAVGETITATSWSSSDNAVLVPSGLPTILDGLVSQRMIALSAGSVTVACSAATSLGNTLILTTQVSVQPVVGTPAYATLKAQVIDYLDRPDLTPQIPSFVSLFEAKLNRLLRTAENEVTTVLDVDPTYGTVDLPRDYKAWRSVTVNGRPLVSVTPDEFSQPTLRPGWPYLFTIIGRAMAVGPVGGPVALIYYKGVDPLSDLGPTNWLIEGHPDLYLYGTLSEAFLYMRDTDRANDMLNRAANAVTDLMTADIDARWGRSRRAIEGPTP